MKRYHIKGFSWGCVGAMLLAMTAAVLLFGCGAPAAAPSPPIDLPTPAVLKFVAYDDLKMDLSSVSSTPTASISKALTPGVDNVKEQIGLAPDAIHNTLDVSAAPVMNGLGELEVPIGKDITHYEANVTISPDAGTLLSGGHNIYLDFAPFDFDNSGAIDGIEAECKGNTAELPICVRFWLGGRPFLAGIFEEYPFQGDSTIPDTIGKGTFKLLYEDPTLAGTNAVAYNYEGVAATETKNVEFSYRFTMTAGHTEIWNLHIKQLEQGPADTAFKRLDLATNVSDEVKTGSVVDTITGNLLYLGQFVEGSGFWGGSIFRTSSIDGIEQPGGFDEKNMCASIPDGLFIDYGASACGAVGPEGIDIRVDDQPFIDQMDPAVIAFPTDFPASPPVL